MAIDIQSLPEKIEQNPHWRVRFRLADYNEKRLDINPGKLFELVEQTQVNLRGWPYPFLSENRDEQIRSDNYIASGVSWSGHEEYWRLYYSGQFIHIFSIREKAMPEWDEMLRKRALHNIMRHPDDDLSDVPGFLDITNTLYHITEIFEFANRYCSKNSFDNKLEVSISLNRAEGFALMTGPEKFWHGHYSASSDSITKTWEISPEELMANSTQLSLEGTLFFLSMFGWDNPSIDIFKQEQEKFLSK